MRKSVGTIIYHNLANAVSILGVLPLCLLFLENGAQYLIPLIVYNNIMDDLDGILAAKLHIKSEFGAILDNVCDAFTHTLFIMLVAMWYADLGNGVNVVSIAIVLSGLAAATALLLRVVTRLSPNLVTGTGSATNELMRHLLFVLLLSNHYEFNPAPVLIATFVLHAASMLAPFQMPYLIRSLAKSATAVILVNVALVVAWLFPSTLPVIAGCFIGTYLCSFLVGGSRWFQQTKPEVPITEQ
jgi:phosphatidylglycerophosphate synthase